MNEGTTPSQAWELLPCWFMWLLFRFYDWQSRRLRRKLDRVEMRLINAEDDRHRWNVRYYAKVKL